MFQVLLSVSANKRSRHEPHISRLIERKGLLIAGLDVRPCDIATQGRNARGPLEVADGGLRLTGTTECVKGAQRT
jgi:hypothetical protein